ncbi:MAG: hypothetical protein IJA69_02815 [Clostridia bacterium]|nr:hypothetical protein [Clostridia bacterium]
MEMLEPKVVTEQNIVLKGKYFKTQSHCCVIFVPGLGGAYDDLASAVAKHCTNNGYSFLWARTQSCYIDTTVKKLNAETGERVRAGAMYENFANALPDISAWVNFAFAEGYSEIAFVGHCYGCNKIVYYLNKNNLKNCIGNIFLSPTDVNLLSDPRYCHLFAEAVNNIKNKQPDKVLSKQIYGFCDLTSAAFIRICFNPYLNNLPYKSNDKNYKLLENISSPVTFVLGNKDGGLEQKTTQSACLFMDRLTKHTQKGDYFIVEDGKHSFGGKEDYVATIVTQCLNKFAKKENNNEHIFG